MLPICRKNTVIAWHFRMQILKFPWEAICGFVGPNGSGKTTTIRMLLGLITPTTGSGHVLGESITQPEKYLPQVGAMIEGPAFYPALTGAQNLAVLAKLGGFDTDAIQGLLDLVDLGDRGNSKYKTYSLGMKQRLGIAANGTTVFVSSHLLSEIEMISDHLVMLRLGKVIFSGKTSELLAKQQPLIVAKPEHRNDLDKLVMIAIQAGHSAKIIDESVHVTGAADYSAKFNKSAFDAGIILQTLTPVRASLEDTFFEMTGE